MSGQGKTLQDIYDAGAKRLEGAGQAQRQSLQSNEYLGVEDLEHDESAMMTKMDLSLSDLEAEIHAYLDRAAESINVIVSSEVAENRKFLERLQETLRLACQSLSEDVKHLRDSIIQKFNADAEHRMILQQRELEKGISRLKAEGAGAASQLKELSLTERNEFSSRSSDHILHVVDGSIKFPAEVFVGFSEHALSIDKRTNECALLLRSRGKEVISDISTLGAELQVDLDHVVQKLAGDLEESYQNFDSQLRKHCEDALSAALLKQENLSTRLTSDLLESYQSSGPSINEKSQRLQTDTDHLLEQVKQLLVDVDAGVRENCNTLAGTFTQSLNERVACAREHNQMVADERHQLMERISADLQEIESNFNLRLSQLAQNCQEKLSAVCANAELAIVTAHDHCAAEFKGLSALQQNTIEGKTQQLLRDIDILGRKAVQNIRTAAGDNGTRPGASGTLSSESSAATGIDAPLASDYGDLEP